MIINMNKAEDDSNNEKNKKYSDEEFVQNINFVELPKKKQQNIFLIKKKMN